MAELNPPEPGDLKAAPDPPDYPAEWTADQCLTAYWYQLHNQSPIRTTASWYLVLRAATDEAERRKTKFRRLIADAQKPPPDTDREDPWTR